MGFQLPIDLKYERPLDPVPVPPFAKCSCEHIDRDVQPGTFCSACGTPREYPTVWPPVHLIEWWNEEVFCWNHERAELATIVAGVTFEAFESELLYYGLKWLHPTLRTIGCSFDQIRPGEECIEKYLQSLDNRSKLNKAYKELFGTDPKTMLKAVLDTEAAGFWANYMKGRRWRNRFLHRGQRVFFETVPREIQDRHLPERERILEASLWFVPACWEVFSRLWNEFIHKRMLARKQSGGTT